MCGDHALRMSGTLCDAIARLFSKRNARILEMSDGDAETVDKTAIAVRIKARHNTRILAKYQQGAAVPWPYSGCANAAWGSSADPLPASISVSRKM
ncbi:MAG: hypothetical protein NVS1B14_00490 [Vulcanimicrobiaceae bacterium]